MRERGQLDQATVTPAVASRAETPQIYQRYAAALYGQALLILGQKDEAEQVACDVMVDESTRLLVSREDADAASSRLAVSVLRRCRELTVASIPKSPAPSAPPDASAVPEALGATDDRIPRPRPPGRLRPPGGGGQADSLALLRRPEREALSLVLFGRFGYRQVARELAIPPREAAALLRAALIGLGS
jgi:hypothetical protein